MPNSKNGSTDWRPPRVSRRSFGKTTAMAMGSSLLLSHGAKGEQNAAPSSAPQSAKDEVELKLHNVVAKWGDRLSEAQRGRVRKILQYHVRMLESVRKFPVANGDSPASVLKLMMGEAKPSSRTAGARERSHGE